MAENTILIQFGEQRITKCLKDVNNLNDLIQSVQQYFSVTERNGSIILQRFDESWQEWVDVIDFNEIKDRTKIKAILVHNLEDAIGGKPPPAGLPILGKVGIETVAEYEKNMQNNMIPTTLDRDTRQTPSMVQVRAAGNSTAKVLDPEEIKRRSQIYNLNPDDRLYKYRKAINEATFILAMKDPSLLDNKMELQRHARQKLHNDGFQYKKKKSRSKELTGTPCGDTSKSNSMKEVPRVHISQEIRRKWASELIEDLNEVQLQIDYAIKERERCAASKNFGKALHISKQVEELKVKKRKYENELAQLKKKESQSKRVKKCLDGKSKAEIHGDVCTGETRETINRSLKTSNDTDTIHQSPVVQFKEIEHELTDLSSISIYGNQSVSAGHCNQNF